MKYLVLISLLYSISGFARQPTNPEFKECIHAPNQVEIVSYDLKSDTFKVTWDRIKPEESRLFATSENLVKAVHSLSLKAVHANPSALVGNIYSTDQDLDLVDHITLANNPRFASIRAPSPSPKKAK